MRKFVFYVLPVILYMGIIFYFSSLAGSKIPEIFIFDFDFILHILEYGILGILVIRALNALCTNEWSRLKLIIISSATCLLYGISDEIHQYFVPLRQSSVMDVISDILGGFLFSVIASFFWGKRSVF